MRRSYDEMKKAIEVSYENQKRKQKRRRIALFTVLPLLVVAALCLGYAVQPFDKAPSGKDVLGISGDAPTLSTDDTESVHSAPPIKGVSVSLTKGVDKGTATEAVIDAEFIKAYNEFSLALFKDNVKKGESALSSSLSALLALAMTANGADGNTKAQMEKVLCGMDADSLNAYLYSLVKMLAEDEKAKVNIANSIWVRDDGRFTPRMEFLQTNATYYDADVYKAPFDETTVEDINDWVSEETLGMIEKVIDGISPAQIMFLINAIAFEAEWYYPAEAVNEKGFTMANGSEKTVEFMTFTHEHKLIQTENANGVIKGYQGGKYSFLVLMPDEDEDIYSYINSLDADAYMQALNSTTNRSVHLLMPKFSYSCSMDLIPSLAKMGMKDAFDPNFANFSRLGKSERGNIYISGVKQDTFIEVAEKGTKAAAVTSVIFSDTAADGDEPYRLVLDRPFVYAIIENSTGMPLFMGALTNM